MLFLPGLGADARLFRRQQESFREIETPPWIEPRDRETLQSYAGRFAERLGPLDGAVLCGASFGGMVAYEMAAQSHPMAVVLIGSTTTPRDFAVDLRLACRLVRRTGVPELPWWLIGNRVMALRFGAHGAEARELFGAMAKAASPRFIRWAVAAVAAWRPSTAPTVAIHRIHGTRDRIIRPVGIEASGQVAGAGHLLTLTHPDQVNGCLAELLRPATA